MIGNISLPTIDTVISLPLMNFSMSISLSYLKASITAASKEFSY